MRTGWFKRNSIYLGRVGSPSRFSEMHLEFLHTCSVSPVYPLTSGVCACVCGFCFVFSHPIYYFRPSFSLSLLVVTQIRGHIAGSSPPLPTTVRALHFYRDSISAFSSLVDSRRIVLTYARRSQQLTLFYF